MTNEASQVWVCDKCKRAFSIGQTCYCDRSKGEEISLNIAKLITLCAQSMVSGDKDKQEKAAGQVAELAEIIDKALS